MLGKRFHEFDKFFKMLTYMYIYIYFVILIYNILVASSNNYSQAIDGHSYTIMYTL